MRRNVALAGVAIAAAAAFAPLPTASAQCTDLSALGLSECASLCPGLVVSVANEVFGDGFLACTM